MNTEFKKRIRELEDRIALLSERSNELNSKLSKEQDKTNKMEEM